MPIQIEFSIVEFAMPESDAQHTQRVLEELKGKNIAHYSVMLAAYISARVDANRAIFVFSSSGIGLLIAVAGKLHCLGTCIKVVYIGALVSFFVAVVSTLLVHIRNAESIETHIRNEGIDKSMDFNLSTWKYVNYISFAIGLALSLAFTVFRLW